MNTIRWKLFKIISVIGWAVCPEPQRSDLQKVMPNWRALSNGVEP